MPAGGRNLYALSKNSPIWSNNITNLAQNIETGEISFKVTGQDPHFGTIAYKNEAIGTTRGIKIPVKAGQDIAVKLTNPLFVKNFVSYFGEDDKAVKDFKNYQTNKFVIPADELDGVSYVTFRFGLLQEAHEIGSVHSTKVKVEYGSIHTDWSPAPEDLGWSVTALVPTQQQRYLWRFEYIYYSDGSVEVSDPVNLSIAGADADTTGVTEELDKTKQELTAKIEKAQNDSLAAVEEAKQELTTVANDLSNAKTDLQNAVSAVDTKATNVQNDLSKAKQDLASQAQQLQEQANAQSELTNRVSSVEETANGTKTTVSELSKTVDQNSKNITSVTARTKVVEDDLAGTKTTLSQVKTTADSTSQKTATLESGLNGLSAKFDNLKIGGTNLLLYSADPWQAPQAGYYQILGAAKTSETYNGAVVYKTGTAWSRLGVNLSKHLVERGLLKVGDVLTYSVLAKTDQETPIQSRLFVRYNNQSGTENINGKNEIINLTNEWQKVSVTFTVTEKMLSENNRVNYLGWEQTTNSESGKYVYYTCNKIERGNVPTDYSPNDADFEQKVAEYKQTADQNYASLSSTVQNLDGTVQQNKATAEQTAAGFKTRIESLETYKDGETTRANQYFESAKTETARQLTVERTAIAKDYVAKSTYTSDVTGIRNELSATTSTANATKTNLANYQASNDKLVANLQSSLQTTEGNVSNLQTKVEAVPGQITSAVSAVEGKIPTEIGGRNLYDLSKNAGIYTNFITDFIQNVKTGEISFTVTGRDPFFGIQASKDEAVGTIRGVKIPVKAGQSIAVKLTNELFVKNFVSYFGDDDRAIKNFKNYQTNKFVIPTSELAGVSYVTFRFGLVQETQEVGSVHSTKIKVEYGNVYTDWSPAPEDTASQISSLSSQIQQTADGMTLLATKTELNTAKSELQSGISTATSKANNAQATANNNAQTISTHTTQISALNTGLSAKVSQTDFNTLSGRVTTAENNITAKANELSSKITSVEGKIPSGEMNLIEYGRPDDSYNRYSGVNYVRHDYYYRGNYRCYALPNSTTNEVTFSTNRFKVERNTDYTLYFKGFADSKVRDMDVYYLARVKGSTSAWDGAQQLVETRKLSSEHAEDVVVTFNSGNYDEAFIRVDNNATTTDGQNAVLYFGDLSLKKGKSNKGWSPSLAELASSQDLKSAQSEFKQTTDTIKASVQSLDNSTVKSSSLTINTDGVVIKAGKSTSDFANAIGSYFSVNQNAINLFSDKINVKGDMIVDGAITGDKIKANSVDVTKIVGIDADYIKAKIEYAMIDWLKGKTITAYNDNMTIDLQNGRISFKDGSNAVYRQTPDGIHTGFLHFEEGSQGGVYAAFGATSTRQGINSKSSEFAGIRCYRVSANGDSHDAKVDKIEVIGDAIQFGHGYESDGQIGGGFIMDTAVFGDDTPYSLNRVIKSIEALWRVLHDHAKNTGYQFNDSAFINALNNEYNAWHDMHND